MPRVLSCLQDGRGAGKARERDGRSYFSQGSHCMRGFGRRPVLFTDIKDTKEDTPMLHCFRALGVNIALDVLSGAVHVLDDMAFEALTDLEAGRDPRKALLAK